MTCNELALLQDQLEGLAKTVAGDTNLPMNMEDYLVTLNSLKKRIKAALKVPDDLIGGTKTGRTSSRNPWMGSKPRTGSIDDATPEEWDAASKAERERAKAAMNPHTHPPVTNRRAAIEHTRKLNELGDNS